MALVTKLAEISSGVRRSGGTGVSPLSMSKAASAVFFSSFYDELTKLGAKSPTGLKVPKPGTNLKGMERVQLNPGKTPITAPGQANASVASTSGVGHSFPVGRTGTSANPAPPPPAIR